VAVFNDSQAAIQQTAHLEPGPRQQLATRINRREQDLVAHGIATEIHCALGNSGIPENNQPDPKANLARDSRGDTVIERPSTSASHRARRISVGWRAAKANWQADKCSEHFSYRLMGTTGTKRPVPTTSVKSLASKLFRLSAGMHPLEST